MIIRLRTDHTGMMMYYSELVRKAMNIMFEAHRNDTDKGGYPYVFHPFFLATQMEDENSTCVALLHDLIEDHGDLFSFDDLRRLGFPEPVVGALRLLTHDDSVPYMDYIAAISQNRLAKQVKIADLRHNLDSRRINGKKARKYDLYVQALSVLEGKSEIR